jgi:hypothetical protein
VGKSANLNTREQRITSGAFMYLATILAFAAAFFVFAASPGPTT